MLERPDSTRRVRGLALKAALMAGLAQPLVFLGPAHAQSSQDTGNMQAMPRMGGGGAIAPTRASTTGIVESVNISQRKIKLNTEPIPAFGWPAMSMMQAAAPSVDHSKVNPGSKVKFTLPQAYGGTYPVQTPN